MKRIILFFCFFVSINIYSQTSSNPSGAGTTLLPYLISNINELYWIQENTARWDKVYQQTADIDASSTSTWFSNAGWPMIGSSANPFTGTYDGQGYTISGLNINRSSSNEIGLFGKIQNAVLHNIKLTLVNIVGYNSVGALVGYCDNSSISNCYTSGNVRSTWLQCGGLVGLVDGSGSSISNSYSNCDVVGGYYVGGFVGISRNSSKIDKCYATGDVSCGMDYGGGFVGINYSEINNSYSLGNISSSSTSNWNFAGFVGKNDGSISKCYCIGDVDARAQTNKGFTGAGSGTYPDCFWDSEASNQIEDYWVTNKSTTEMKTASTFSEWDSNIWNLDTFNDGYPYLDWQNPGGSPLPVELINFVASISNSKVVLYWQTATEVNNYGFEVQRLKDEKIAKLQDWETIGFVEGHGNSNSPKDYSFVDSEYLAGQVQYRLKQIDIDGGFEYSDIVEVTINSLSEFKLSQNYPNPFNPTTTIKYEIGETQFVTLKVYNSLGQEVTTLVNKQQLAGNYEVEFNAKNLPSGIYFYKIESGQFLGIKKLVLLK